MYTYKELKNRIEAFLDKDISIYDPRLMYLFWNQDILKPLDAEDNFENIIKNIELMISLELDDEDIPSKAFLEDPEVFKKRMKKE